MVTLKGYLDPHAGGKRPRPMKFSTPGVPHRAIWLPAGGGLRIAVPRIPRGPRGGHSGPLHAWELRVTPAIEDGHGDPCRTSTDRWPTAPSSRMA